jgi:hypothetical protein
MLPSGSRAACKMPQYFLLYHLLSTLKMSLSSIKKFPFHMIFFFLGRIFSAAAAMFPTFPTIAALAIH